MTRTTSPSKVLLLADTRSAPAEAGTVNIRRFRIARLRLDGRQTPGPDRYEYLKRVYD